jgi:hypothetical protein
LALTGTSVGERFAGALLAKDWDEVMAVLDPEVDFRGLTPGRPWAANTAGDLIDQVLTHWFGPDDEIYEVLGVSTDRVVDRDRVVYRFRIRNPAGDYVCEQTAYYNAAAGRITTLRVLCTGFLLPGGA